MWLQQQHLSAGRARVGVLRVITSVNPLKVTYQRPLVAQFAHPPVGFSSTLSLNQPRRTSSVQLISCRLDHVMRRPPPAGVVPGGHLRKGRLGPAPGVQDTLVVLATGAEAEHDGGAGWREDVGSVLARGAVLSRIVDLDRSDKRQVQEQAGRCIDTQT